MCGLVDEAADHVAGAVDVVRAPASVPGSVGLLGPGEVIYAAEAGEVGLLQELVGGVSSGTALHGKRPNVARYTRVNMRTLATLPTDLTKEQACCIAGILVETPRILRAR